MKQITGQKWITLTEGGGEKRNMWGAVVKEEKQNGFNRFALLGVPHREGQH
jgi:hypothetical protein